MLHGEHVDFSTPISGNEMIEADSRFKADSKAVRAQGIRLTAPGKSYIQAAGPVRPIFRPSDAPERK